MSVTFEVEGLYTGKMRLIHWIGGTEFPVLWSERDERDVPDRTAWEAAHVAECPACESVDDVMSVGIWDTWDLPSVNLANGNAATILATLGFSDLEGVATAALMRSRIEAALAFPQLGVRQAVRSGGPGTGQALFEDPGMSREAYEDRLRRLLSVVEAAEKAERDVRWY